MQSSRHIFKPCRIGVSATGHKEFAAGCVQVFVPQRGVEGFVVFIAIALVTTHEAQNICSDRTESVRERLNDKQFPFGRADFCSPISRRLFTASQT